MQGDQAHVPYRLAKRVLDKSLAGCLLVVLAPVGAVAAGAMALDMALVPRDRGRWLLRERRITRGREFDLLKLRIVREDVLAELERRGGYVREAEEDPGNLTWAGRHVVKPFYLDELPQLLNVLRGDMSLVGPRPWPITLVRRQEEQGLDYRHRIVAGWTGPAQVQKGRPDPESGTELDLAYLESCRRAGAWELLRTDLELLVETVRVLARGQGLSY